MLARPTEFRSVRHRKCNPDCRERASARARALYNKIHGLVRKSRSVLLPISSEHVSFLRQRCAARGKLPFPVLRGPFTHTGSLVQRAGNSLFRSRGDSSRARYKRIFYDSSSCRQYRRGFAVCLYNTAKYPPRVDVALEELDGNDIPANRCRDRRGIAVSSRFARSRRAEITQRWNAARILN